MKKLFSKFNLLLLVASAAALCSAAYLAEAGASKAKQEIHFGFASSLFPESTSRDFRISFQLWLREVFEGSLLNYYEPKLEVFDIEKLNNEFIEKNNIYMLVLNSVEFLEKEKNVGIIPVITTNVAVKSSFVVVSSKRFGSIEDLRASRLTLTSFGGGVIAEFWMKYLLARRGISDINSYFKIVASAGQESEALLSVFFGKTDACVIRKDVYETTCELNPQIRKSTNVLESSPGLLQSVFCFTDKFKEQERKIFMESAFRMDNTQAGRQILTFFGQARLLRINDENMSSIRRLYSEYMLLKTELENRKIKSKR